MASTWGAANRSRLLKSSMRAVIAEGKETTASMAALLGVGRATLWRALKR